jgi:DNA-binding PadR family transcriptional regulator
MLDFAILGLLMERPRHGYEIKRALAQLGFWTVSFGSLYPALRRLEKRGAIVASEGTGRRKAYEVTSDGRGIFEELLATDPMHQKPTVPSRSDLRSSANSHGSTGCASLKAVARNSQATSSQRERSSSKHEPQHKTLTPIALP